MKRTLKELRALTKAAQGIIDHIETMHPGDTYDDLFIELKESVASAKNVIYEEEMKFTKKERAQWES